jgi:hypothetical protein
MLEWNSLPWFFVQSTYVTPLVTASRVLNPDSAFPADAMSEEQTFRSEVNGSLPLSGNRSSVVQDEI